MLFPSDRARGTGGALAEGSARDSDSQAARERLQAYFRSQDHQRRGICLLNAGQFDLAARAFAQAEQDNPDGQTLPALMAACAVGRGEFGQSAAQFEKLAQQDDNRISHWIRLALSQWKAEQPEPALATLRQAITQHGESAELHFQLGTLLATL
ncbi:MAG: hypothetical protein ACE5GE_15665, partial [Phycisphaerae bacterium]